MGGQDTTEGSPAAAATEPNAARGRGRPRDDGAETRIRDACQALLGGGYDSFSMDQVAARASVSKTTLYRRWPSKVALVMDVWAQAVELGIPVPDTGSARGDLLAMVSEVAAILDDSMVGHALPSLVDVRFREPTFAVAFGELFAARRALLRTVLQRWVERGELRADVDLGVVLDQLLAPLYYRWLLSGEPIDGELVTSIVEQVLAGCARPPTRRPRPAKARNVKAR